MPDPAPIPRRLHDLISRRFDGLLGPDEHRELAALLEAAPAARRRWFLHTDIELALAARATRAADGIVAPIASDARGALPPSARASWLAGSLLAVAGVIGGVFFASAVWAFALPRSAGSDTVMRVFADGFEGGIEATRPGLPTGPGGPARAVWYGDEARAVTSRQGVRPAGGTRMLAFERSTHAGEHPAASAWSDVYRLVDARPFLVHAEGDAVTARLSASFATAADACADGEAYSACVHVYALDRGLSDAPQPVTLAWVRDHCVASGMKRLPLVGGREGWQPVAVDASLPPQARFMLVHVAAVRERPGPTSEPAVFRGHFVDDVALELRIRKAGR